jgi:hypothetical protein
VTGPRPPDDLPNPLWDRRWILASQAALILGALAVIVLVVGPAWRWGLFFWGALVGLSASALIVGIGWRATAGGTPIAERRRGARRRLAIYAAAWLLMGVLAGFGAALADTAWPDVLLLAFAILTGSLVAAVVIAARRSQP